MLEQHGPALLRFCRSQAGADRGEDVFQETMLAALRAWDTVRDPAAIRSWLFSIAARKAVDAHRAAARSAVPVADPGAVVEAAETAGASGSATAAISGVGADDAIWSHVARLPAKQRQAVALRFVGDLSHAEIAVAMGTSEAAARRNVFEGLRRLRGEVEPVR